MRATGVGSLPGEDYLEAVKVVLGELGESPGLPHVPELPARGAVAGMVGRALAVVDGLDADLQPAGWRLTGSSGSPGVDHRRARSLLAQDLDTIEEQAQGAVPPEVGFKTQVTGPWTLAATVERPRGDKVLADHGARRDLAQALAEGVGSHVRDLRRRLPDVATLVVQVDEPALAAVLGARVPTASGFGKHRAVEPREASETLAWVLAAIIAAGGEPWVHSCAPGTPLDLLRIALRDAHSSLAGSSGTAGAAGLSAGLSVDLDVVDAAGHDRLAEALEAGVSVALGVVPSVGPAAAGDPKQAAKGATDRVVRWLDMLGLDPTAYADRLFLTPACGLAGATAAYARTALATCRIAAASLG